MFGAFESITGGLFSATITKEAGASNYFSGSVITYSNEVKQKLNIDTTNGVINAEVALQMVKKCKIFFNVDHCIAFTGNAGPIALENKPIGLVYIALDEKVYEKLFYGNRISIQNQAVIFGLKILRDNNLINN